MAPVRLPILVLPIILSAIGSISWTTAFDGLPCTGKLKGNPLAWDCFGNGCASPGTCTPMTSSGGTYEWCGCSNVVAEPACCHLRKILNPVSPDKGGDCVSCPAAGDCEVKGSGTDADPYRAVCR